MPRRDEFSVQVKNTLAKRVGHRCSNPTCGQLTSGPHSDPYKSVNEGAAAHITAAAPNGPRYDSNLTPETRSGILNGIWLCNFCADMVDHDPVKYPVEMLKQWKNTAELRAKNEIEQRLQVGWAMELPKDFGRLISLHITTPPAVTDHITQSNDGQFWVVHWDCRDNSYKWSPIRDDYAEAALRPIMEYYGRSAAEWRTLFERD